jgi:outer membrane beta-barrel protein
MRFILLIALFFSIESQAVKIQFPEDELASESVLPKFDNPEPVKNRNVVTKGKFEVTAMLGWTLNDVFVDPLTMGGIVTYHLTEIHAIQFYANKFSSKINGYPAQIDQQTTTGIPNPAIPESAYLLAYQITPYYGKLSTTKQGVTNMSLYGTAGLGTYQVSGAKNFALSAGIGSKVYFTKKLSLRIDYRWLFFKAEDPINQIDTGSNGSIDKELPDRAQFNSILTVGAGYLF